MAMRPLEKLPSIRAKLGSVIVIAVGVTVVLVFLMLAYALRDTQRAAGDATSIDCERPMRPI